MNKEKKGLSLITPIIFFIIGAILLAKSEDVFNTITLIIGIILIIYTLFNILSYVRYSKKGIKDNTKIFQAILSFTVAIVFLFFNEIIYTLVNFIVGGIILFIGINRFIKGISHKRIPLLVMSCILIVLGIYTILEGTNIFWSLTGIIIMISSAIDIINYIMYGKEDNEEIKKLQIEENTELIVQKKDNKLFKKKPKNIKDIDPK
jgi:phosphoglycerol transferase MdoB-like AlkP superfamily enzyme